MHDNSRKKKKRLGARKPGRKELLKEEAREGEEEREEAEAVWGGLLLGREGGRETIKRFDQV